MPETQHQLAVISATNYLPTLHIPNQRPHLHPGWSLKSLTTLTFQLLVADGDNIHTLLCALLQ